MADRPNVMLLVEADIEDVDVAVRLLTKFHETVEARLSDLGIGGAFLLLNASIALRLVQGMRLSLQEPTSSHRGVDSVVH